MIHRPLVVVALALAPMLAIGCAGNAAGDDIPCSVGISISPSSPIAGPASEVRATSVVTNNPGVSSYGWSVVHDGATIAHQDARADGSEITFLAVTPGIYRVTLDVDNSVVCPRQIADVTARANGDTGLVRLHVTPPLTAAAPPIDRLIDIPEGGDYALGAVVLDPGVAVNGVLVGPSGPVSGYLRFGPLGTPEAIVEGFAAAAPAASIGAFAVRLVNQPHGVLVVPDSGLPPQRLSWTPGQAQLTLAAGSPVTGVVVDPAGAPISGARVQLTIDGVPSTLATTLGDGSYTATAVVQAGATVTVEMTPPPATGLPQLEATGTFDLTQPVDIGYRNTVVVRNLGGLQVRRGGTPVANAKVTIVGSLGVVGTVQGASANATGRVRIAATADATGVLPSTLAPAGALQAVVQVTSTDVAVTPIDLTVAVPATVTAPAMSAISTVVSDGTAGLAGGQIEVVPRGALAMAGVSPSYLTAGAGGVIAGQLATGGSYDLFIHDPAGRVGAATFAGVTAPLAASYLLPPAVFVTGTVSVTGNPNAVVGASVQILCTQCLTADRSRPIAEVATDLLGEFVLAVPDPGAL